MNLVLIGYRGTGKSTIGRILAEELQMKYVSLDEEITYFAGMSIPEIVEQYSWDHFRDLEERVVASTCTKDNQILDAGGGVVVREINLKRLRKQGIVFLLEASVEDIVSRIGGGTDRPSLTGRKSFTEEVVEVLEQRNPRYRSAADFRINTSEWSPQEAARQIAADFRERTAQVSRPSRYRGPQS